MKNIILAAAGVLIAAEHCNHCRQKTNPLCLLTLCSIAEHIMAKVEYAFPVEKIHGKVAKHHKIGFAHRAASKLNYTQAYGKRTTKYSQAEKDHQAKFAAVAAATNARLADPNQMPIDQMAFKAQSKYTTLRQYVWNQEWNAYTPA